MYLYSEGAMQHEENKTLSFGQFLKFIISLAITG